jgi:hypothetical protein
MQHRDRGDQASAEQRDALADVEDALADYAEQLGALESGWLTGGWRLGAEWTGIEEIRRETKVLETEVVRAGQDPLHFDKWVHSSDPAVERQLRKLRARLLQLQKLEWRAEILAELGQAVVEAETAGTVLPTHATGFGQTAGAHEYRDAMLGRLRGTPPRDTFLKKPLDGHSRRP